MDWLTLSNSHPRDRDLPRRAFQISCLQAVLEGRQYDTLPHDFSEESEVGGQRYIPLRQRRPSVRSGLCRTVVDDSVSLLFGEGHFPQIAAVDKSTADALAALVKSAHLSDIMSDAAVKGSVGSVAILVRVLSGKPFVSVMQTANLAPVWNPRDPDRLLKVVERYKVQGVDLIAQGYPGIDAVRTYWFQRIWDETSETWFLPYPVIWTRKDGKKADPVVDADNTVQHGLGVVPIVWVKNLPGGDDIDGAATFNPAAISTIIEMDYLLSQAGRALRIAGDPLLLLKTDKGAEDTPNSVGGASDMLVVPTNGDAKLLEINGDSARASLEHCKVLRQLALEAMHGNRADADKISAAQSGRALEMMNQGLVWLADKLRVSYGERALIQLLRIICDASHKLPKGIVVDGVPYKDLSADGLALQWPDFYPPTPQDRQQDAQTLTALRHAGILSRRTAVQSIAPEYDIESVDDEIKEIEADEVASDARAAAQPGIQVKASETLAA